MQELVNKLREIQQAVIDSGITFQLEGNQVLICAGRHKTRLDVVQLNRPSSQQVQQAASLQTLLVLVNPSTKATDSAASFNHLVLPDGGWRILVPGVALMREVPPQKETTISQVRLKGRTGLVVEALLLGRERSWSIQQLAQESTVSAALVHRVLARLEAEGWLETQRSGPTKTRTLINPLALAETWSQEEAVPQVKLRGYLYGSTPEAVAQKAITLCPDGALSGALAANLYNPTLTHVPYPVRLWVPEEFWLGELRDKGLEETDEGANLEILQAKGNPWQVYRQHQDRNGGDIGGEDLNRKNLPKVSPWRAWVEISTATGRTRELADTLLRNLQVNTVSV